MTYKLVNADCFDYLAKIENQSIDMMLLDLPWGAVAQEWDKPIDLDLMWGEIKRIAKKKCQILFFCNAKHGYKLINSNPRWFKSDLIWVKSKPVGHLTVSKTPMKQHENIYLFNNPDKNNGLKLTYNPQMTTGEYVKPSVSKKSNGNVYMGEMKAYEYQGGNQRFPTTLLNFSNSNNQHKYHPTQKPTDLLEWLIRTYSNEDDLVLDFTAGSCSTGVAAMNTNRQFICVEKNPDIFKKALERFRVKHLNCL